MKKNYSKKAGAAALAILTLLGLFLFAACKGPYTDPSGGASTGINPTNPGTDTDTDTDTDTSGGKPALLPTNASYSTTMTKLDECINYCQSVGNLSYESYFQFTKGMLPMAQSSWTSSGPSVISEINAQIAQL